jgi:hypothetical protein
VSGLVALGAQPTAVEHVNAISGARRRARMRDENAGRMIAFQLRAL